ncbi:MAG: heparinase II/III family protein [Niabella sp.]
MKWLLAIGVMLLGHINVFADPPKNLIQNAVAGRNLQQLIVNNDEWISYPDYKDRAGWEHFAGKLKRSIVENGEQFFNYQWEAVKASDYLAFERSGDRDSMQIPYEKNNHALISLIFAELVEGKGRFMNQIVNGVWFTCDMSSWALSAHLIKQKTKRSLPDYREQIIDLVSGDIGSLLSWGWYFFHESWDRIDPIIAKRVAKSIQDRIIMPYLERNDFWWLALNRAPATVVNNWNPWCNFNVLTCFLLMEDNSEKKIQGILKTIRSVDAFINYIKEDGACEEGPSYWQHAAGKLYDYLQLLCNASKGNINVFKSKMLLDMGEYISRSYIGNGWIVNFADASGKGDFDAGLIFRYGKAVASKEMTQFAGYLINEYKQNEMEIKERDFFRAIEYLKFYEQLEQEPSSLNNVAYTWYPQTEFCYMRNDAGLFFAAKGGFNNESHNHNDVGTFSLYIKEIPFFIDAGVGTYTKQTFGTDRYSIWTMRSEYHNLPLINGYSQKNGLEYKASQVRFEPKRRQFSLNIAGAFNSLAKVDYWKRTYLVTSRVLKIIDDFKLNAAVTNNEVHFMTWSLPDISKPGRIILERNEVAVQLKYEPSLFIPFVDTVELVDKKLSDVWGDKIYRIRLVALNLKMQGKYNFEISELRN